MSLKTTKETITSIEMRFSQEDIETVSAEYHSMLNDMAQRLMESPVELIDINKLLMAIDAGRQVIQVTGTRLDKLKRLRGHASR